MNKTEIIKTYERWYLGKQQEKKHNLDLILLNRNLKDDKNYNTNMKEDRGYKFTPFKVPITKAVFFSYTTGTRGEGIDSHFIVVNE